MYWFIATKTRKLKILGLFKVFCKFIFIFFALLRINNGNNEKKKYKKVFNTFDDEVLSIRMCRKHL